MVTSITSIMSEPVDATARDIGKPPDGLSDDLKRFLDSMREVVQELAGRRGDADNAAVRWADLRAKGFVDASRNQSIAAITGPEGPIGPPGPAGAGVEDPDPTPPPTLTGLTASAGLTSVIVQWDAAVYTQGHGPLKVNIYAVQKDASDPTMPTFPGASGLVMSAYHPLTIAALTSNLHTRWHIWAKYCSKDGYESASPAGGTNGVQATTGKVGNADLGTQIVEAQNIADEAVEINHLHPESIDLTKFVPEIEPVTLVSSTPATKITNAIFNVTDQRLYKWDPDGGAPGTSAIILLHLEGTNGATSATDSGGSGSAIAFHGDAAISTARFAHGASSMHVSGAGYIVVTPPSPIVLSGDFTIRAKVYVETNTSDDQTFFVINQPSGPQYDLYRIRAYEDALCLWNSDGGGTRRITGATTISTGGWKDIEWTRSSGVHKVYLDGVSQGSWTDGSTITIQSMWIGAYDAGLTDSLLGNVDEVYLNDEALHTADFNGSLPGEFTDSAGGYVEVVRAVDLVGQLVAGQISAGAIVASHLSAGVIAVGSAAIANGAIVNAMIANGTIDDAKIATLAVSKLLSGTVQVGTSIQSSGFVDGVQGWLISGDGTARLLSAHIRDLITASKLAAWDVSATRAIIATAGIGTAQIEDLSVSNSKIGNYVRSNNFDGSIDGSGNITANGSIGWAVGKGGKAVFQDIYARGDIQATSLSASAINVIDTINLAGDAVVVPQSGQFSGVTSNVEDGVTSKTSSCTIASITTSSAGQGRVLLLISASGAAADPNDFHKTFLGQMFVSGVGDTTRFTWSIKRNGVSIRTRTVDYATGGGTPNLIDFPMMVFDSPGPGVACTYTYELKTEQVQYGTPTNMRHEILDGTYTILEVKR